MEKLHIRNLPILLLWMFSFMVTVYVVNRYFIDVYIVPKWLSFGILYALLLSLCSMYRLKHYGIDDIKEYIYLSVAVISTIEAVRGICENILYHHPINGCFDNAAGYASMQCLGVAFILHFCRKKFHVAVRVFAWLAIAIVICSLMLSQSRAGILVSLTITMAFMIITSASRIRRFLILGCGIFLIGVLVACFYTKTDSTEGRKFILDRSCEMIQDKPLFGFGIGGFKLYYMDYQAEYFASNEDCRHSILADNIKHPLNEYVKIVAEYGIVGFLCLISGVFLLYRYVDKKYNVIDSTMLLSLVSIALFGLFSYPLQYPHTWLILSLPFFLSYAQDGVVSKVGMKCSRCMLVIGFLAITFLSVRSYKEWEWGYIYHNHQRMEKKELLCRYEKLYTYFKSNPYFLYNYAHMLYRNQEYDRALLIANECNEYWHDYNLEILRGDIYDSVGDKDYAIYTFINASHMCPNRFMPLHKLFRMALKQQDYDLARFYAEVILSKPIKVDSTEVQFIINECYNYYHYNKL